MYDEKMSIDHAGRTGPAKPRRRPRGSLNQRVILDAAFALTERGGLDAVTFQALGAELGQREGRVEDHALVQAPAGTPPGFGWPGTAGMVDGHSSIIHSHGY